MRPRCPSVGPEGYRCRRRLHDPVPPEPTPAYEVCHRATGWQGLMFWDDGTAAERPTQMASWTGITGEEVAWDVERLIEIAATKEPFTVPVDWHVEPDQVDPKHWRSVDVHTPIILVPHPVSGHPVCVDGRHRLYKAWRQHRGAIPAVMLTEEEERSARVSTEEFEHFKAAPDWRWA